MPDQTALRSEGGGGEEEEAYFLFLYARRAAATRSLRRWLASHFREEAISDGRKSSVMRGFSLQDCNGFDRPTSLSIPPNNSRTFNFLFRPKIVSGGGGKSTGARRVYMYDFPNREES